MQNTHCLDVLSKELSSLAFRHYPSYNVPKYREFYVRWLQFVLSINHNVCIYYCYLSCTLIVLPDRASSYPILVIPYKAHRKRPLDIQSPHSMNITLEHRSMFVKLCNNQCCIQMLTNTLICELHKLIYILLIAQNIS